MIWNNGEQLQDLRSGGALIDIRANREARKWSRGEQLGRILWAAAYPMFRLSPRICWAWRNCILRLFGAAIGNHVHIFPTVRVAIPWNLTVDCFTAIGDRVIIYNLGKLQIGEAVTISQGAHLCGGTHDYRKPDMPLVKSPISIGDGAWVCADAFVGPGVSVGNGAVVGARSVVVKDVAAGVIVAGNPARQISTRNTGQLLRGNIADDK